MYRKKQPTLCMAKITLHEKSSENKLNAEGQKPSPVSTNQ